MNTRIMKTVIFVGATGLFGLQAAEASGSAPSLSSVRIGAPIQIPVIAGEPLSITASGSIAYDQAPQHCASVDPRGCKDSGGGPPRPLPEAAPAALIGTFVDAKGVPVALSFAPGEAAELFVPKDAEQLVLAVNLNAGGGGRGEFEVAALPASIRPRSLSATGLSERAKAQHLLRRFGFSASPSLISAIAREGVDKWFVSQLTPNAIDDSYASSMIEPLPTTTNSVGFYIDWNVWERRLVQREIYTARQVQEKMVLHWLDHFSVGNDKVSDPALMSEYESVIRAHALGNFATLASEVARTPAMLEWLDNNYNDGSNPILNPPNENFARELMQLYTIGPYQLNMDGSAKVGADGVPIPSYTENDVKQVARGLTGFYIDYNDMPYSNPETRFSSKFGPWIHTTGPKTILGKIVNDPDSAACAYSVIASLASYPSSAPFLAKELLQRVAVENPSPRYVAAIANVWQHNLYAPNQIALVLEAIERDPEFYVADYHSMPKEPVELIAQFARDVPVALKVAHYDGGSTSGPGQSLLWYLYLTLQEPYNPPSVFSFYRPGDKEFLISQVALLERFNDLGSISGDAYTTPTADTAINLPALRTLIGARSNDPATVEAYLLDAMVDSSSTVLPTLVKAYLGTRPVDDEHLAGAIWLISTSPEFEVN